ncbi:MULTISPECIES: NUDIX hydrolase [Mucilaginibacter]|jgi:ADP-ribose pyrophosphatase YjhB (NUDIX family)|uniref:NUDIX hydrolase n=2 Tax=Mucilaginibacter TaxID=423349 RepID=A0AAE6MGD6_9SPHI|nr:MULTISPECIES: NUDIX domain-containing protein [Mucilaginibacter]NVM67132.1 ADP-ribose pyrophosphatase YjhB (NUDIX family) [Mucilaginibacter sp. SG538B]QEM02435.1 NUDIX hydrolase [Mucilaginibacter rubeus]QEM15059.1 NUDIX hydrolase [Mucilaginibacter gossypii]QTE39898.1 NUDIX domain-containing protein [Mucilaginibacter gossypii]QTE42222.1 NUDIX hydrolase [Mucilaginibacter rubeus]
MLKYSKQTRLLLAVDCIIFGFDGEVLKILLIKRGFQPEKGNWSLMGGFVQPDESLDQSANRILKQLTGLEGVYLEQLYTFGQPQRDPIERTVSVAYFALVDIHKYEAQISDDYHAEWFQLKRAPKLIFDQQEMVEQARKRIRYKAAMHPILFELLPTKFTIPQLQTLYESVFNTTIDKRNFSKRVLATGLLIKLADKDKAGSKRGAYYYQLNMQNYYAKFQAFMNFIPNPDSL